MAIEAVPFNPGVWQFSDASGVPYAGGSLTFVQVGTNTAQNVYSDSALTVSLGNVVTLNAAGRTSTSSVGPDTPVYFQQLTYDVTLKDANSVTIWGPITFSGSQWPGQIQGQAVATPAANANSYTNRLTTTIAKASSGTHALIAGTRFDALSVTAGGSTVTESATVYIDGAPNLGTNAYALHVGSTNGGAVKFDGSVTFAGAGLSGGRLTLTSGSAAPLDVTGATTIYYTPYLSNLIALFDGVSAWSIISFSETSLALGTLASGAVYDVFGYNNGGTLALRAPVAWASTTTRATAIVLQNGVYVKSGTTTDKYLGTFVTTATTTTEDSLQNRYLFNQFNRVPRPLQRVESTASWNYTSNTIRQANGSTSNQVNTVFGSPNEAGQIDLTLTVAASNTGGGGLASLMSGIGVDSTTTVAAAGSILPDADQRYLITARYSAYQFPVGIHFYSWNEAATNAVGTSTFYGTQNFGNTGYGLYGWVMA